MPPLRWYRLCKSAATGNVSFVPVDLEQERREEALFTSIHLRDGFHGHDRVGTPLYWMHVGQLRLDKLYATSTHQQIQTQILQYLAEQIRHVEQDLASPVTLLFDLDGLSWHHMHPAVVTLITHGIALYQGMKRPELVSRVLVVNGSWLLPLFWSAVQPLIPLELRERIEFPSSLASVVESSQMHPHWLYVN